MRNVLTLLTIIALAILPGRADAATRDSFEFDPVQQSQPDLRPQVDGLYALHNFKARPTQSDGMTLSQAVESVRRRTKGEVVKAETRVQGGREVHYIRVLKDGKLKTHRVNGRRL